MLCVNMYDFVITQLGNNFTNSRNVRRRKTYKIKSLFIINAIQFQESSRNEENNKEDLQWVDRML